jgi:hypothetical protein
VDFRNYEILHDLVGLGRLEVLKLLLEWRGSHNEYINFANPEFITFAITGNQIEILEELNQWKGLHGERIRIENVQSLSYLDLKPLNKPESFGLESFVVPVFSFCMLSNTIQATLNVHVADKTDYLILVKLFSHKSKLSFMRKHSIPKSKYAAIAAVQEVRSITPDVLFHVIKSKEYDLLEALCNWRGPLEEYIDLLDPQYNLLYLIARYGDRRMLKMILDWHSPDKEYIKINNEFIVALIRFNQPGMFEEVLEWRGDYNESINLQNCLILNSIITNGRHEMFKILTDWEGEDDSVIGIDQAAILNIIKYGNIEMFDLLCSKRYIDFLDYYGLIDAMVQFHQFEMMQRLLKWSKDEDVFIEELLSYY